MVKLCSSVSNVQGHCSYLKQHCRYSPKSSQEAKQKKRVRSRLQRLSSQAHLVYDEL